MPLCANIAANMPKCDGPPLGKECPDNKFYKAVTFSNDLYVQPVNALSFPEYAVSRRRQIEAWRHNYKAKVLFYTIF